MMVIAQTKNECDQPHPAVTQRLIIPVERGLSNLTSEFRPKP
jgi:hypothetical protein